MGVVTRANRSQTAGRAASAGVRVRPHAPGRTRAGRPGDPVRSHRAPLQPGVRRAAPSPTTGAGRVQACVAPAAARPAQVPEWVLGLVMAVLLFLFVASVVAVVTGFWMVGGDPGLSVGSTAGAAGPLS